MARRRGPGLGLMLLAVGVPLAAVAAVAMASGGKKAAPAPVPPAERPGYKVLPGCAGFEVWDEAAAVAWARETAKATPGSIQEWAPAIEVQLLGPDCAKLGYEKAMTTIANSGRFIYRLLFAAFQGGIDRGVLPKETAAKLLADALANLQTLGADISGLPKPEEL